MLISIGILAWNEETVIDATIASLFQQSALQSTSTDLPNLEWEIIVVPNGCLDNTAEVARNVLSNLVRQTKDQTITFAVHELAEPGKSNAWNHYIHEFSSKDAELILMIDADIEFGETETISNTVKALLQDPHAVVAVDLPLKDVVKKANKTVLERISIAASSRPTNNFPSIAGSFFCSRADVLRQIWMPRGLVVEDGFLRSMILTDCFRSAIDYRKIIRAENASHYFETLTSLKAIFRHELRMVIGTALNCYLTWDLLLFATDPSGPGAGVLIRNRIEMDPSWYPMLIKNAIRNHGFWVLPRGTLFRRFSKIKGSRGIDLVKNTFIATASFLFDLPVFIVANHRLKKGSAIGYW